jgi:hypothetical protein
MRRHVFGMLVAAVIAGGCTNLFKSSNNPSANATPQAMTGAWTSLAPATLSDTCTDFRWTITDLNGTTGSGTFTAKCLGTMIISGTASGTLTGTTVTWTATANGTSNGSACAVSLNGTATFDGTQFRIPYSGTTCLGPISGVEILRKS